MKSVFAIASMSVLCASRSIGSSEDEVALLQHSRISRSTRLEASISAVDHDDQEVPIEVSQEDTGVDQNFRASEASFAGEHQQEFIEEPFQFQNESADEFEMEGEQMPQILLGVNSSSLRLSAPPGLTGNYAPGMIKSRSGWEMCLDYDGSNRNLYLHPCHGSDNQLFYWVGNTLRNRAAGPHYCADMAMGSGNGAHAHHNGGKFHGYGNLYMSRCHFGKNQEFKVEDGHIKNLQDNWCVDATNYDHKNVWVHKCHSGSNQDWTINGELHVMGKWKHVTSCVDADCTCTEKHGTSKTSSVTRSSEWSSSVTTTVEAGIEVSSGVVGASFKASVSASVGQSLAQSYSSEWTTDREFSTERKFHHQGDIWQFEFDVTTVGAEDTTTTTGQLVMTPDADHPPRCLPKYCAPGTGCQSCRNNRYKLF